MAIIVRDTEMHRAQQEDLKREQEVAKREQEIAKGEQERYKGITGKSKKLNMNLICDSKRPTKRNRRLVPVLPRMD